ncbi:hypothetical protein [Stenotrophomonas oahuensis]|uniref:Uncharacterized protein n=1 Tax=Stenotrophomonas oahuensis TaxID=3003271 RepID=A0ABY9YNH6_9GAMM|nr:hypothetical protein [Stenotrophomonas sp. A5586]WNH52416.1 hypothetical protein PDM29_19165 [Stenotrophomonas sp. A5586]
MYVSYNIAKNGRHLFATAERQTFDITAGLEDELRRAFPASEGYSISRHSRPSEFTSTAIEN